MIITAIDPGTEKSACCEVYPDGVSAKILPNDEMLQRLRDVNKVRSDLVVIEMIASFGMPVGREVFETCVWIGRFQEAWESRGGKVEFVYRKQVCLHLCGSPRAKDGNIRQALIDRYGGQNLAIGGKKCPKCKGRGWFGAGRPVCPACEGGEWLHQPGPLVAIVEDMWAALAVAVTYADTRITTD